MKEMKVFHIDCGRKYFSAEELKRIVLRMGRNGFTHLELAFGNNGLRFFLDDMELRTPSGVYGSDAVRAAVDRGNRAYCDCGRNELTEAEMEELIRVAGENGIRILPLLSSPGHMNAVVTAMEKLGIRDARYRGSATTFDPDCPEAAAFAKALTEKYIAWFAARGSDHFNMGCDEFAEDVPPSGFAALCDPEAFRYDRFVTYVNGLAETVLRYGMKPVMFNDGMYYAGETRGGIFRGEIVCSYWTTGWPGYTPAPAALIERMGHPILNTAAAWYYVLGRRKGVGKNDMFNDQAAFRGIAEVGREQVPGGAEKRPVGAMLCLWCDEPEVPYSAEEEETVGRLIDAF